MTEDRRASVVEARVGRCCLGDVTGREADILKSSSPTTARVADPAIFDIACDYSLGGEGGAEMPNMCQVIT